METLVENQTTTTAPSTTNITQLLSDLNTTITDLSSVHQGVNTIDYDLQNAISYISYPSEMSGDLTDLTDGISALIDVLSILELFPDASTIAKDLKKVLGSLKDGVSAVNKPVKKVANTVKPYKKAMEKLEKQVNKIDNFVASTQTSVINFRTEFNNIYQCINKLSGEAKTTGINALEVFSGEADSIIGPVKNKVTVNGVLQDILTTGTTVVTGIEAAEKPLKDVAVIGQDINKFASSIGSLLVFAKDLNEALNHKISVPYGIKVTGPWYEPWDDSVKLEYFTFTVQEIINGIDDVIEEVEDLLIDALGEFLDPIINKLKEAFDAVENDIKNAIGKILDVTAVTKDIADFDESIADLVGEDGAFGKLSNDVSNFVAMFTQFESEVKSDYKKLKTTLKDNPCVQAIQGA